MDNGQGPTKRDLDLATACFALSSMFWVVSLVTLLFALLELHTAPTIPNINHDVIYAFEFGGATAMAGGATLALGLLFSNLYHDR